MSENKASSQTADRIPVGLELVATLPGPTRSVRGMAWAPDGTSLAVASYDAAVRVWHWESGHLTSTFIDHRNQVYGVDWHPDGSKIASSDVSGRIFVWEPGTGQTKYEITGHSVLVPRIAWSPDGLRLASVSLGGAMSVWESNNGRFLYGKRGQQKELHDVAWSPDGKWIATGGATQVITLHSETDGQVGAVLSGHTGCVRSIAWSPDGAMIASGGDDQTIRFWDPAKQVQVSALEGHTNSILSLRFAQGARILASKEARHGSALMLWSIDDGAVLAKLDGGAGSYPGALAAHPFKPLVATVDERKRTINIWQLNYTSLTRSAKAHTIKHASAKIVLVGESNVGKSCLAMRIAENRYPREHEQGSTHGMRFWPISPEKLDANAVVPDGQRREVVLWDMGGQDEYRLVHQLFLHGTTVALVLIDPTRGRVAFDEAESWTKALEKHIGRVNTTNLLVGTKMDQADCVIDEHRLRQLQSIGGFSQYIETSAYNGRGVSELKAAIASALDWDTLTTTARPVLFQKVRDEIEVRRAAGEVVVHLADLERIVGEPAVAGAVVEQLAMHGEVAAVDLASGDRVVVLQVGEIERYAGSLIVAARNNPRGVAALEERAIISPNPPLPRIRENERLPRNQERVVLECVVQLLVEHGICFSHEGLLVFPSLFGGDSQGSTETPEKLPHAISLHYDFSGAIDNIYASMVAWIELGERFGRVRLHHDRAEFETARGLTCGLRKVERGRGFAHLDVYFGANVPKGTRDLFIEFVEGHLTRYGIQIVEHLEIECSCGHRFDEEVLRARLQAGHTDVGCPACDLRTVISEGARQVREKDPEIGRRAFALRTKLEKRRKKVVEDTRRFFSQADQWSNSNRPVRVLHLSDLHFHFDTDPNERLQPLILDLRENLKIDRLDYLVLSGDLTHSAKPEEFELAFVFTSNLIKAFGLNAERCLVVPGNHDQFWDEDVYSWKPARKVVESALDEGGWIKQGDGYLIRSAAVYPRRFQNFDAYFHHPLKQIPYPMIFERQCVPVLFEEDGLQFIGLNSSWQLDEWFRDRSSIHPGALARGLAEAEAQVVRRMYGKQVLRIAVVHHPLTGNDKIHDDAFVAQLQQAKIQLVLHGHVHEDRADAAGYFQKTIPVVGAGSFGAPARDRPESTPRLYNLMEIAPNRRHIVIKTRCMRKEGGAWDGWAVWPSRRKDVRRTWYRIPLG